MTFRLSTLFSTLALGALTMTTTPGFAQDAVLNLYSARHYQTDEALYANFTQETGIKINRIEMGDEALLERLRNEGRNSPADVILLVDAARLFKAESEGLFQPTKSSVLTTRIPAQFRASDDGQGSEWFGFSSRARVIVYNKVQVPRADVASYELLADPKNKGRVCTRSAAHPYMLSLIGSMIERLGEAKAEEWARGMVANSARPPRGGDTDQIKAVASGECGVALTNSYYWVRMLRSSDPKDRDVVAKVGFIWPNQGADGTHVNISGGGVAKYAPNRSNAQRFLEYLASDQAQAYFADGNNEWPIVKSAIIHNPALDSLGAFKAESVPMAAIARNTVKSQKLLDRVGWK